MVDQLPVFYLGLVPAIQPLWGQSNTGTGCP